MLTPLQTFYLFNDTLLFINKDFVGVAPKISKGMTYEGAGTFGTTACTEDFEINGVPFSVTLTRGLFSGPPGGFQRMEVQKAGAEIISYEQGGRSGGNYRQGQQYFVEGTNAFLIAEAGVAFNPKTKEYHAGLQGGMKYLFLFEEIVVPTHRLPRPGTEDVSLAEMRQRVEVEDLFQMDREAELTIDGARLHIAQSAIPDFQKKALWRDASTTAQKYSGLIDFRKVIVSVDGVKMSESYKRS